MLYICSNHSAIANCSFIIYCHYECDMGALTTQPWGTAPLSFIDTVHVIWVLQPLSHRELLLYHLLPLWMWYGYSNHSAMRYCSFIIYWHCECYIGALTTQPSRTAPLSLLPLWMWYVCSNHSAIAYCSFIIYCHCECDMGALTTQPWGTAPLSVIDTVNVIQVL